MTHLTKTQALRKAGIANQGRNPPEQSLEFDLILAMADKRFIRVVQMVYGRAGFVYGVHWHDTGDSDAVISIFPDLR